MITLITFSEPLVDAEHPPMNISMKNTIRQVEGQLISVIVNPEVVITLIHCTALNLIDSENEKSEINVSVSVQSTIDQADRLQDHPRGRTYEPRSGPTPGR